MKNQIFLLMGFLVAFQLGAQNLRPEVLYPDTLKSAQDSFYIYNPNFDKIFTYLIDSGDTLNLGTTGHKGNYFTIYTDLDTLVIPHVNFPYKQVVKIPITSPNDSAICFLRFNEFASYFTDEYANQQKNKIDFDIPEAYELANIILFLSQCSEQTGNHPETIYSQKVDKYFNQFRDHKLIQILNKKCSSNQHWDTYYGFRENSICFEFDKEGFLQFDTQYKHVKTDEVFESGGHFRNMLYMIQDFATKSNFQAFYKENQQYYDALIERQGQLLPIKTMWEWIENEFPQRLDSYRIIFSPLIGGSHSTQRFLKGFWGTPEFEECIMFINSPERIDGKDEYSESVKEGLMSGVVFTEIDHNYVNPTSEKYFESVKELISNMDFWATAEAQKNYSNEFAIFNEYMTHALFCLYITENYKIEEQEEIIRLRINLMERRGYLKFEQFNTRFLDMMKGRSETVYELYPEIIEGMKNIK